MKSYRRIAAVATAIDILSYLSQQADPVTGAQIAKELNIPTATVMCHLVTLQDKRLIHARGGCFEIGMGMAVFWHQARSRELANISRAEKNLELIGGIHG